MNHIHIETLRKDDFANLATLSGNAWGYHAYSDKAALKAHAIKLDAHICSALSNHSLAVYDGDRLIGVILAYIAGYPKSKQRFKHYFMVFLHGLYLKFHSQASRKILKDLRQTEKAYRALLKAANLAYKDELVLFITHSDYQGQGIGKALITAFENQLQAAGRPAYFLFTDTSCNYGFYDHHGFTRERHKTVKLMPKDQRVDLDIFLYTKTIK